MPERLRRFFFVFSFSSMAGKNWRHRVDDDIFVETDVFLTFVPNPSEKTEKR